MPSHSNANSTRLSLAIADLPLTPFGMKSSSEKSKIFSRNLKTLNEHSNYATKLSRNYSQQRSNDQNFHKIHQSSIFNVNKTRRKLKRSDREVRHIESVADNEYSIIDVESIPKKIVLYDNNALSESIFTDIDDGSFMEFPERVNNVIPPYYTCLTTNDTEYSTSSKNIKADVGFRKYIDKENGFKNIISREENCLATNNEVVSNDFPLDETVIIASRDFMPKNNNPIGIMNSTINPNSNEVLANNLPDISSLALDDSPLNKNSKNANLKDKTNNTVIPSPVIINSLISEDLSICSSDENSLRKEKNTQKYRVESTNKTVKLPQNYDNDRVTQWVLHSPFKDGSFATSFYSPKNSEVNSGNNRPHNHLLSQNLQLRISQDSSCGDSESFYNPGGTIYTLGKIAESPNDDKERSNIINETKEDDALLQNNIDAGVKSISQNRLKCKDDLEKNFSPIDDNIKKQNFVDHKDKNIGFRGIFEHLSPFSNSPQIKKIRPIKDIKLSKEYNSYIYSSVDSNMERRKSLSASDLQTLKDAESKISLNNSTLNRSLEKVWRNDKTLLKASINSNSAKKCYVNNKLKENTLPLNQPNIFILTSDSDDESGLSRTKDIMCRQTLILNSDSENSSGNLQKINKFLKTNLSSGKLKKEVKEDLSIIVVSDSSTNNSPEIRKNIKPKVRTKDDESLLSISSDYESGSNFVNLRKKMEDLLNKQTNSATKTDNTKSKDKKNNSKCSVLPKLHLSSDSSSDDNFSEYLNKWKTEKRKSNNKIELNDDVGGSFLNDSESSDDVEFYLPIVNRENNKNVQVMTPFIREKNKTNFSTKDSSTSDSDSDDVYHRKFFKPRTTKTPKIRLQNIPTPSSNRQNNFKTLTSKELPKTISFLSSLSLETPIKKAHPDAVSALKNFKKEKESLTEELYSFYNDKIFDQKLPKTMKITWNARLTKTAGLCYYQIDKTSPLGRGARIELSVKVIDNPGRLRDTLIHEVCHAAAWIVSGYKGGHGPVWKSWAGKAMRKFPELPTINRCHSYEIQCKYLYRCVKCGQSVGRHSKSLDTDKKVCGICHGKFELIINSTKKGNIVKASSVPSTPRTPNAFALYVKENYSAVKQSKRLAKHGDVMKELSEKFSEMKAFAT